MKMIATLLLVAFGLGIANSQFLPHQILIVSHGADFLVKDPIGKRWGFDFRRWIRYNERHGSEFLDSSVGEDPAYSFGTDEPTNGEYKLTITQQEEARYTLEVFLAGIDSAAKYQFQGVIAQDLADEFAFTYTSSPGNPGTAVKIVTHSGLRQTLSILRRLGDVAADVIRDDIGGFVDRAESRAREGDTTQANTCLDSLISYVHSQAGGGINEYATAVLVNDVGTLKTNWPPPSRVILVNGGSIQAAIDQASPGDVIRVMPGNYLERLKVFGKSGLTLMASNYGAQSRIQGLTIGKSSAITVRGFCIAGVVGQSSSVVLLGGEEASSRIAVEGNEVKDSPKGLHGIEIGSGNTLVRIVNNLVHSNGTFGISVANSVRGRIYVINNTIVRNGQAGLSSSGDDTIYVVNNIISFNGIRSAGEPIGFGVWRPSGASARFVLRHNLIVGNRGDSNATSSSDIGIISNVFGPGSLGNLTTSGSEGSQVSASPSARFEDVFISWSPFDLRLQPTGVAIDRCPTWFENPDGDTGVVPDWDFWGVGRPRRGKVDMGAGEADLSY
jgi:hypothetical protein